MFLLSRRELNTAALHDSLCILFDKSRTVIDMFYSETQWAADLVVKFDADLFAFGWARIQHNTEAFAREIDGKKPQLAALMNQSTRNFSKKCAAILGTTLFGFGFN